jgi:D-sedoheptulose 7-phosphate isomerase
MKKAIARGSRSDERRIVDAVRASAGIVASLADEAARLAAMGKLLVRALRSGGKVLTAGNGGSAAEALHMAEELTGRFRGNRRSLPGLALVADPTVLTCIANDFGFDAVFSRQVEGLGCRGDVLVLFSTSGAARNLRLALGAARRKKVKVICLLGRDGGALAGLGDMELIVRGEATERIQEAHQVVLHLLLDQVERAFAGARTPRGRG